MWPWKKKSKSAENLSQVLLGFGIALLIFNLPIFLKAYLAISPTESLAGIVIGIIFLVAGLSIAATK